MRITIETWGSLSEGEKGVVVGRYSAFMTRYETGEAREGELDVARFGRWTLRLGKAALPPA